MNPSSHRQQFESALSRYTLSFLKPRVRSVEDRAFPPMVDLYQALRRAREPFAPTQSEFTEVVMSRMPNTPASEQEAVRARIYRTYTAMVQQHHFELVLREHFDSVTWDPELDKKHGIDLVVTSNGKRYGFNVSVHTELSAFYKSRKAKHYDSPPFPVLDVLIQPRDYVVGRFWLYNPATIDEVHAFIELNHKRSA